VARIVVLGSAAQDEVLWLRQPLHEGRHLDARQRTLRLGGGGVNTAVPLGHAGHQVSLVSMVGTDGVGDWLLDQLRSAGIEVGQVRRVRGESTRSLVMLDPAGERTIVNLHRCREPQPPGRLRTLPADAVYVRSRETDLAEVLAARATAGLVVAHVPPLADGSRPATVLVGSESDLPPGFLADPWGRGRAIAGDWLRWVVVTRGAAGASAWGSGVRLSVPARVVEVVDTTAAGDVFAAGLVHALVQGRPMEDALRTAVAWGSAAVACAGLPARDTVRSLA